MEKMENIKESSDINSSIINLDSFNWKYNYDSDKELPIIPNDIEIGDYVKFICSNTDNLPYSVFRKLNLKNVCFDFDISFDYTNIINESGIKFETLECTGTLDINIDCYIIADNIICNELKSFASKLQFETLKCNTLEFRLTNVVNSENISTTSNGPVHTDNSVILSRKKFKLDINKIKRGLTIID